MFKAFSQQLKKPHDENIDSADELEVSEVESFSISRKLPESCVMSRNLFQSRAQNIDNPPPPSKESPSILKNRSYSQENKSAVSKNLINSKSSNNESITNYTSRQQASQIQAQLRTISTNNSPTRFNNRSNSPFLNKENTKNYNDHNHANLKQSVHAENLPYTELANKIYNQKFSNNNNTPGRKTTVGNVSESNLLLSINAAQRIDEKRNIASKEAQENVVNRLFKQNDTVNEHTETFENSNSTKELGSYTFAPHAQNTKSQRNFDQFLQDQKTHQDKAEEKKKKIVNDQILKDKYKEETYKPEICQKSAKLVGKKNQEKGPAYQRLYNSGKKSKDLTEKKNSTGNYKSIEGSNFMMQMNGEPDSGTLQRKNSKCEAPCNFKPEIHKKSKALKRDDRIDNILYHDALRRQNKFNEASKPKKLNSSVTMSLNSKRAIATRFIKEFDYAVEDFLEEGKSQKLNYVQLNELLINLCFLKESENIDNPRFVSERVLLYDLWHILKADKYKGIHRRNLLVILLAILNLHFPITKIDVNEKEGRDDSPLKCEQDQKHNPLLTEDEQFSKPCSHRSAYPMLPEGQPPREKKIIGTFDDEGNYELTAEDVKELHKLFEPWYINRLSSGDNLGQFVNKRNVDEEPTFHPEINEISKDLAHNYREKMLAGTADLIQKKKIGMPKDGKLTHVDLLIASKKVIEEKVNKYGDLIKEEQNKEYTFRPQISPYHNSNVSPLRTNTKETNGDITKTEMTKREKSSTPEPLGKERVFELYSLAKSRVLKQDKDPLEREYEKNHAECTFQPNIGAHRNLQIRSNSSSGFFAKGIEKSIERIRNARAEKGQLNSAIGSDRAGYDGQFVFSLDKNMRNNSKGKASSRERREKSPINRLKDSSYLKDTPINNRSYSNANIRRDISDGQEGFHNYYEQYVQNYGGYNYAYEENHDARRNPPLTNLFNNMQDYNEENLRDKYTQEISPYLQKNYEDNDNENDERVPLLFVDVNLGQGRSERITVFEGDTAEGLAEKFCEEYKLEPVMKEKLRELLDVQIAGLLSRIDEEMHSGYSETERHNHRNDH